MSAAEGVKYDGPTWDTETDEANPQPLVYPACEGCGVAYVYRRALSFTTGTYVWAWMKDCQHDRRKAQPGAVIVTPDTKR